MPHLPDLKVSRPIFKPLLSASSIGKTKSRPSDVGPVAVSWIEGNLTARKTASLTVDRNFIRRFGARGRNRTSDTAIFSRMLYQLSYPGDLASGHPWSAAVQCEVSRKSRRACPAPIARRRKKSAGALPSTATRKQARIGPELRCEKRAFDAESEELAWQGRLVLPPAQNDRKVMPLGRKIDRAFQLA
jgi:hypothetical protein